jgi:DNA-binding SARP family transcriptional activator/predicted ATPase
MPFLRLYLLGSPQVERNEIPVPVARRKTMALLAYLAVTAAPSSREALATLLWPDHDQSGALANLRRDLSRLNKIAGPDVLVVDRMQVSMQPGEQVWTDVQAFRSRVERAREHEHSTEPLCPECLGGLEEAISLYKADFLAGFNLPDSPKFDDWQFFQAEELRSMLGEALQQLIQARLYGEEFEQAIEHARRWLSLDPLHEPAHRMLMQLYAWNGHHSAALRQFQECERLLTAELGVKPEAETQALYSAIKSRQLPPPPKASARSIHQDGSQKKANRVYLPGHATPFIGRDQDLAALSHLLESPEGRLVTILGPGGIGKSRLSVEAARSAAHLFPDGVYFISLAPLHSAADIPFTIAEILGNQFFESSDPKGQLLDYLRGQKLLLVLDNFEHLLEGAGFLVEILAAAPEVRMLVSSREKLNISSEQVYSLGNLSYPADPDASDILAYDAVQLLLQSARHVRPDYEPQDDDLPFIVRICQLVQGMPLALILAAGWFEALSLEDIAAEITQSLDILETELQDIPDRQQSLRAVFDSSWNRLSPEQQQAYVQLSVFRGGFTRQAALEVAGADLKTIRVLLNKSWLHLDSNNRYQVHELLRQFAFEKLVADQALLQKVREQHSGYYAGLLVRTDQEMRGPSQMEAFRSVTLEFENIRAAWHFLIELEQPQQAVDKILPALFRYCESRSRTFELFRLLDELEAAPGISKDLSQGNTLPFILITARESFFPDGMPVRFESFGNVWEAGHQVNLQKAWQAVEKPDGLLAMGFWGINLAYLHGRIFQRDLGITQLKSLLPKLRQSGNRWEVAYCLQHLVQLFEINFDPLGDHGEIERIASEAIEIFEQLGDERESGYTLKIFGQLRRFQHRIPEAIQLFKSAQEKLTSIGDWPVAANIHGHLGDIHLQTGQFEDAFRSFQAMTQAYLEKGHKRMAASSLSKESYEALRYSDLAHAKRTREHSLALARETGDDMYYPWYLWELGEIYRVSGEPDAARRYFDRAYSLFIQDDNQVGSVFYHRSLGDLAHASGVYGEAIHHFKVSIQHAREVPHDWAESYGQTGLGRAAAGLGDLGEARSRIAEALRLAKKVDEKGIALVALEGAAEVFAAAGDLENALGLVAFIRDYPVAWRETKDRAGKLLTSLYSSELGPETGSSAGWQGLDLWEVVAEVTDQLDGDVQAGYPARDQQANPRSNRP